MRRSSGRGLTSFCCHRLRARGSDRTVVRGPVGAHPRRGALLERWRACVR